MRHGPPARDGIPSLHSDGEALPAVACLSSEFDWYFNSNAILNDQY